MRLKQITLTLLIFILVACSPAPSSSEQPSVETIVAGTLEALTASAPVATEVNGTLFTDDNISFVIPTGIATSVTEEAVQAVLPAEGMPWWGIYPTHMQYLLQGYPITDNTHDPQVYVYPIAEYIPINDDVAKKIEVLQSLIANPNQTLPERLPFLPTWNAGEMFHSNLETVSFQNGYGIRYITEYSQFPHPISNGGMIYTFQGITNDGLYYVSAVLPINIGFLIDYPTPTDQGDFEAIQNQVELVTQQLNNSKPEAFTPSLLVLDSLVQSMNVTGIP